MRWVLLERATGQGWSLKRLREKGLKTAAGILARSGVVLEATAVHLWQPLFQRLDWLSWAGG